MSCAPGNAGCGGPSPTHTSSSEVASSCAPQSWTCGQWRYVTEANGCTRRELIAAAAIPDGVYRNATITMANGCIASIASGSQVVSVPADPCVATPGGGGGVGDDFEISADPCNLLTAAGGQIAAKVYMLPVPGSGLSVSGCGTSNNPFMVNYAGPGSTAGGGYTGSQCGITVSNGVILNWAQPVMNVLAGPGLVRTYDPVTCTVTISLPAGSSGPARLPAVVCDSGVNPPSATIAGTPSTVYTFKVANTAVTAYTVTTSAGGFASVSNMQGGIYEVFAGGVSLGYVTYVECTYVDPTGGGA